MNPIPLNAFPDLQNPEVQEIINRPSPWLVRWGTTLFCALTGLICIGTQLIKYPDIIKTQFVLTASDVPRKVLTRNDGKLTILLVKDGADVVAGQKIGFMESAARPDQVLGLSQRVSDLAKAISLQRWSAADTFEMNTYASLGELQDAFRTFAQQLTELKSYLPNGFYIRKGALIRKDQHDLLAMEEIMSQQLSLQQKDYQLAQEEFLVQEKLFENKVISVLEYKREKAKLLAREMPVNTLSASLIQNRSARVAKEKELLELENQIKEKKEQFQQALHSLYSAIEEWEQKYVISAPVTGKVSFLAPLAEQQHLKTGQELMIIEPKSGSFRGLVKLPQNNLGKIIEGQKVLVKLDGFPYREYGVLEGRLAKLSVTPGNDSAFWGYIDLPNKLRTRYGRTLPYRNGLKGQAEIVTADRTLASRLLATVHNGSEF
jgi:HlyD family secretion protein